MSGRMNVIAALFCIMPVVQAQNVSPATMYGASAMIEVSGKGTVAGAPDQAILRFAVRNEATNPQQAVEDNNTATRALIDALKALEDFDLSLQTEGFSLNQHHKTHAYQVSNNVKVTTGNVDQVGTILAKAVAHGANHSGGVQFTIADATSLYQKALKLAVEDAKTKAQIIADASGRTLGPVQSVTTEGSGSGQPPMLRGAMMAESISSVPIETGEQSISASVVVVFTLL